jgi:hypothetical protein
MSKQAAKPCDLVEQFWRRAIAKHGGIILAGSEPIFAVSAVGEAWGGDWPRRLSVFDHGHDAPHPALPHKVVVCSNEDLTGVSKRSETVLIAEHARSGLSIQASCQPESSKPWAFRGWRHELALALDLEGQPATHQPPRSSPRRPPQRVSHAPSPEHARHRGVTGRSARKSPPW